MNQYGLELHALSNLSRQHAGMFACRQPPKSKINCPFQSPSTNRTSLLSSSIFLHYRTIANIIPTQHPPPTATASCRHRAELPNPPPFILIHPVEPPCIGNRNYSTSPFQHQQFAIMADDKKREDFTIELGDQKLNGSFEAREPARMPSGPATPAGNNPVVPILAYCGSSILMTVTNKYVLSGLDFNLNFFLLAVQVRSAR